MIKSRFWLRCLLILGLNLLPHVGCAAPQPTNAGNAKFARSYLAFALQSCDRVESTLPILIGAAQLAAERQLQGGSIGVVGNGQVLPEELVARSGGLINIGFGGVWKAERSAEQKAHDVGLVGWERAPQPNDLATLQKLHQSGVYLIGFGPRGMPELAPHVALCDLWFDSGLDGDDGIVELPNGTHAGHGNALVNMLNSWAFIAEFTAALTRQGRMPPFYKSGMLVDGSEWNARYRGKMQFHDDYQVAPIEPGVLSRTFLDGMRENMRWFEKTQLEEVQKTAGYIVEEVKEGRPVVSALIGHATDRYVGKHEDAVWSHPINLYNSPRVLEKYRANTPDGALVLRLGYTGLERPVADLLTEKKQRVLLITTANPRPEWQASAEQTLTQIDMGWKFGDALLTIPGYPPRLLPPSGIMQVVAYESINCEVMTRLPSSPASPVVPE